MAAIAFGTANRTRAIRMAGAIGLATVAMALTPIAGALADTAAPTTTPGAPIIRKSDPGMVMAEGTVSGADKRGDAFPSSSTPNILVHDGNLFAPSYEAPATAVKTCADVPDASASASKFTTC
ncbi:MAG TPA: hypothetical protein VFW21_13105 [Mycobacterium sp.]|nr:hypothetical protein [Mycobacterium sp.]